MEGGRVEGLGFREKGESKERQEGWRGEGLKVLGMKGERGGID